MSLQKENRNGPYRPYRRSIVIISNTRGLPMTEKKIDKTAIRPFKVNIPEADLADLKRRIKATRWPERETVKDFTQGVQLGFMQKVADYWANEYDWRKCEARLNSYPNFLTEIDGLDIHFIHVKSKHENAL